MRILCIIFRTQHSFSSRREAYKNYNKLTLFSIQNPSIFFVFGEHFPIEGHSEVITAREDVAQEMGVDVVEGFSHPQLSSFPQVNFDQRIRGFRPPLRAVST